MDLVNRSQQLFEEARQEVIKSGGRGTYPEIAAYLCVEVARLEEKIYEMKISGYFSNRGVRRHEL